MGKKISYSVVETVPNGYENSQQWSADNPVIVNTMQETSLSVSKSCRYHDRLLLLVSRKSLPGDLASNNLPISELHGLVESIGSFSCGASEEVPLGDGDIAIRQALEAVSLAVDGSESLVQWSQLGWDAFAVSARDGDLFSRCCKAYQSKISTGDKRSELMRAAALTALPSRLSVRSHPGIARTTDSREPNAHVRDGRPSAGGRPPWYRCASF